MGATPTYVALAPEYAVKYQDPGGCNFAFVIYAEVDEFGVGDGACLPGVMDEVTQRAPDFD